MNKINEAALIICMAVGLFCMVDLSNAQGACADEWPTEACEAVMIARRGDCGPAASSCELTCGVCQLEICENSWGDEDCSATVTARGCNKLISIFCAKACGAYAKDKELRNAYSEGHRQGKLDVFEDESERTRKYDIPLRKPDLFKQGQNFRRWLKSFNLFSKAAKIHDSKKLDCLLTFLDEPSQSKIETLNLTPQQKADFQECCELIERAIEGSNTKAEWRNKLFKCKQANNETITDFVTRLTDLADRCYGNESSIIKNQILLDCFLSGILSESIAFEIMKDNCTDYLTAYKKALDLEGIKACRRVNTINTDQNTDLNVEEQELFAIQKYQQTPYHKNQPIRKQQTYTKQVSFEKYCHICNMNNHSTERYINTFSDINTYSNMNTYDLNIYSDIKTNDMNIYSDINTNDMNIYSDINTNDMNIYSDINTNDMNTYSDMNINSVINTNEMNTNTKKYCNYCTRTQYKDKNNNKNNNNNNRTRR
ncbi:hypothetical protein ACHWQZ_G013023 [Mnemiopsis leidyi]